MPTMPTKAPSAHAGCVGYKAWKDSVRPFQTWFPPSQKCITSARCILLSSAFARAHATLSQD